MSGPEIDAPNESASGGTNYSPAWQAMSGLLEQDQQTGAQSTIDGLLTDTETRDSDSADDPSLRFEALADPSVLPVTVFPFLRQVNERLAKFLSQALRTRSGTLVDVVVTDQVNLRLGNAAASIPVPSLIGILQSEDQEAPVFAVADGAMAALYFDLLLGASQIRPTRLLPVRNFSLIETSLFQTLAATLATAANNAFAPLHTVALKADRVETNPRFVPVSKAQDSVIKIRMLVQSGTRSGFIDFYMTSQFLRPIDAVIRPSHRSEVAVADPHWQRHLSRQLGKSHIELRANLSELTIPLYRLRNLKTGDVLPLDKGPDSLVELVIDNRLIGRGRMGRSTGKIAIQMVQTLFSQQIKKDMP